METIQPAVQESLEVIYNHAARMLIQEEKTNVEVVEALINQGVDQEIANIIVSNLQDKIEKAKKERAQKDMLYGALWCIGGIVATLANIGFIFWGAILFGGIQFFKGLINSVNA